MSGKTLLALGFWAARGGGNLNKAQERNSNLCFAHSPGVFTICKEMASPPSSYFGASARQLTAKSGRKQSNFSHSPPNPRAADDDGLLLCMYACTCAPKPQIKSFSHRGRLNLGKLQHKNTQGNNFVVKTIFLASCN